MESFVDACSPNPCKNAGTCTGAVNGGFTCACKDGFSETTCQTGECICSSEYLYLLDIGIFVERIMYINSKRFVLILYYINSTNVMRWPRWGCYKLTFNV